VFFFIVLLKQKHFMRDCASVMQIIADNGHVSLSGPMIACSAGY